MLADGSTARGSITTVTRIGDTIRRPAGPWTPTVHALLDYLRAVGFTGAPCAHGLDEQGREVLSLLPGDVAMRPWPAVLRGDQGLRQLALWLREYQTAAAGFTPPPGAVWRAPDAVWSPGMVPRHGDLGAWNSVWHDATLVGFIDWDLAEPGTRLDDLCQLAWSLVPVTGRPVASFGFDAEPDRRRRLAVLCETYGVDPAEVLAALPGYMSADLARMSRRGTAGALGATRGRRLGSVSGGRTVKWAKTGALTGSVPRGAGTIRWCWRGCAAGSR